MAQPVDSIAPRGGGKQLLLVGSGHGHLQLLARLAAQPLAGVQVTLVAPLARQFCAAMVPGFVAGDYALAECAVELAPLLRHAAVRSNHGRVVRVDAQARSLQLDDGSTLGTTGCRSIPGPCTTATASNVPSRARASTACSCARSRRLARCGHASPHWHRSACAASR